jgi:hypothetical protein
VALVALLSVQQLSTSRALAIWIVLVAGIVLLVLIRRTSEHGGREPEPRFEQALRAPKAAAFEVVEFLRMQRELDLGVASAAHAHSRLLPLLRAAASARLATRHGIDLARRPDTARSLLGDDVWDLLRPDRPEPEDRLGPGVRRDEIAAAIEAVESL